MSLILRKQCQDVLDTFKLQEYHTAISESQNCLKIVTECGKPLVNIIGIKFNRQQPTIAEIEFAVELLTAFLGTHAPTINSYITKLRAFNKRPRLERKTKDFEIDSPYRAESTQCTFKDAPFKFTINNKNNKITVNTWGEPSPYALTKFKYSPSKEKAARKYLKDLLAYEKDASALEAIKSELSKCDV